MKWIIMPVIVTLPVIAGVTVSAMKSTVEADVEVFGCNNCSLEDAKHIAVERATPSISCRSSEHSSTQANNDRQCVSEPRTFYVHVRETGQIYGIEVSHTNQSSANRSDMVVQANRVRPTRPVRNAIEETMAFFESHHAALSEAAERLSVNFESFAQHQSSEHARSGGPNHMNWSWPIQCARTGSFHAARDSMNVGLKQYLFEQANRYYRAQRREILNTPRITHLDTSSISTSIDALNVIAEVDYFDAHQFVQRNYNWDQDAAESQPYEDSRITFRLQYAKGTIRVRFQDELSRVDGVSFTSMQDQFATVVYGEQQVSECAAAAYDLMFTQKSSEPVVQNGSETDLCRSRYYLDGEVYLSIQSSC